MFKSIVEAVFSHAEAQPEKLCLADENRSVTYGEYKNEICRMAALLKDMVIKKDDKVLAEAFQRIDLNIISPQIILY